MARTYQTLAPARFQVREGVRGGWYVVDTQPTSYSTYPGGLRCKDTQVSIYKTEKYGQYPYWRTYEGAKNRAIKLNGKG